MGEASPGVEPTPGPATEGPAPSDGVCRREHRAVLDVLQPIAPGHARVGHAAERPPERERRGVLGNPCEKLAGFCVGISLVRPAAEAAVRGEPADRWGDRE